MKPVTLNSKINYLAVKNKVLKRIIKRFRLLRRELYLNFQHGYQDDLIAVFFYVQT